MALNNDRSPRVYAERVALLVKANAVRGVDSVPDPLVDAFLVGQVEINLEPQLLERDIYRPSFSPTPSEVGRKPMTISFTHEIKGSGSAAQRSKLGTLLSGCRMLETLVTAGAATQIEDPIATGDIVGVDITWSKDEAPTAHYGSYLIRVTEGGASGVAEMQVFRWNQSIPDTTVMWNTRHEAVTNYSALTTLTLDDSDEGAPEFTVGGTVTAGDDLYAVIGGMVFKHTVTDVEAGEVAPDEAVATALAAKIDLHDLFTASATGAVITVGFATAAAPVVVTSGTTAIPLGASGAEITPTWTGDLTKGQMFVVQLYEPGYMYKPLSDDELATEMTIHAYMDGNLYRISAAMGTVTFTGTAGEYGSAQFEFTGQYNKPLQEPLPRNFRYELTKPPKVELAQMSIRGNQDFCAESFTITLANDMQDRLCLNAPDGYAGSEIAGREPTASINPEGTQEVYTNMWGDFADGEEVPLHLRVGVQSGNSVRFYMDNATYSGISLSDRNRVQVQEPTFQLNGLSTFGDDELRIAFV